MTEAELDTRKPARQANTNSPVPAWYGAAYTHRGKRRQQNEDAVLARSETL